VWISETRWTWIVEWSRGTKVDEGDVDKDKVKYEIMHKKEWKGKKKFINVDMRSFIKKSEEGRRPLLNGEGEEWSSVVEETKEREEDENTNKKIFDFYN